MPVKRQSFPLDAAVTARGRFPLLATNAGAGGHRKLSTASLYNRFSRFKGLLRSEFRQPDFPGSLTVSGDPSLAESAAYLSPSAHFA